jgi:RNA polymerase sigma factor for flagellar operon FliA
MSQTSDMPASSAVEAALWERWISKRDVTARVELFLLYGNWSRMLANLVLARYPHPLAEWGDYVHFASIGLLQALDRFQPDLQTRFQSFAEPYVRGAVLKGLSCYVSDKKNLVIERLAHQESHRDFDKDSAFDTIVTTAIDLAFGYFLELGIIDEEPVDNSPFKAYAQENQHQQLGDYVDQLPERERHIIISHYYQHLSFTEISQLLEISKARVSQLHTQALRRIRSCYEQADDMDFRW